MRAALLLGLAAVVLLGALAVWSSGDAGAPAAPGAGPDEPGRDPLWAALAEERAARERLEGEVAALRLELDFLRGDAAAGPARVQELRDRARAAQDAGAAAADAPERGDAPAAGPRAFDESILIEEARMAPHEAQELREAFQEVELERLFLRDRARREGWGWRRIRQESAALGARTQELRDEYGDAAYDWYLYAGGGDNRVYLGDVLARSPAAESGLEPGDRIVRYDGSAILRRQDLDRRIAGGPPGEPVRVEVDRGGQTLRFDLPRGPLGAQLDLRSEQPRELP